MALFIVALHKLWEKHEAYDGEVQIYKYLYDVFDSESEKIIARAILPDTLNEISLDHEAGNFEIYRMNEGRTKFKNNYGTKHRWKFGLNKVIEIYGSVPLYSYRILLQCDKNEKFPKDAVELKFYGTAREGYKEYLNSYIDPVTGNVRPDFVRKMNTRFDYKRIDFCNTKIAIAKSEDSDFYVCADKLGKISLILANKVYWAKATTLIGNYDSSYDKVLAPESYKGLPVYKKDIRTLTKSEYADTAFSINNMNRMLDKPWRIGVDGELAVSKSVHTDGPPLDIVIGSGPTVFSGIAGDIIWLNDAIPIRSLAITDGTKSLAPRAMCLSLVETIRLPKTLERIEHHALMNCSYLKEVVLPKQGKLEYIGTCAFMGDNRITHIELPDSVKVIEKDAFVGTSITSIRIPRSIKKLYLSSLDGMKELKILILDNTEPIDIAQEDDLEDDILIALEEIQVTRATYNIAMKIVKVLSSSKSRYARNNPELVINVYRDNLLTHRKFVKI